MILESLIDTNSAEFQKNKSALLDHIQNWRNKVEAVKLGGGEDAQKKHKARGKLTGRYADAQRQARAVRAGLWAQNQPMSPRDFPRKPRMARRW